MSNHSNKIDEVMKKALTDSPITEKLKAEFLKNNIGPTGQFPEGKLTEKDDGELTFAVGVKDGKVVFDFSYPVQWIGFTADQAESIGKLLIKRAKKIRGY